MEFYQHVRAIISILVGSEFYQHVRAIISILVGFSLTRLLSCVPQMFQSRAKPVYWVHLVWCVFMFLYTIGFWWWEFNLIYFPVWTFPLYVFVAAYGTVLYLLCALLSPLDLSNYEGYQEYFFSRRKWFFGVMALMFTADLCDDYIFHSGRRIFLFRVGLFIPLCLVAARVSNKRFHAAFAVFALVYEIYYYLRQFFTLT